MSEELWKQQLHPRPAVLSGAAGEIMKARMLEYHGRMMMRNKQLEFLERMRTSRIPELSASQMDIRKLKTAQSMMKQSCEKWSADIAKARKDTTPQDDWSVLDDQGTLEVIPDHGQTIEDQSLQ